MTNKLTINYDNPALIQFRLKKQSFSFFLKSVVVRLLQTLRVKGISVGYPLPNTQGLRTNSKLIPEKHLCKLNENELDNHENHNLSEGTRKERQVNRVNGGKEYKASSLRLV